MTEHCVNCGVPVQIINYAFGPELMHVVPGASFPSTQKGTAWRYCQLLVAEAPLISVTP